MCLSHTDIFMVLTVSLTLGQLSGALPADLTPLEVCTLIKETYPQFAVPECTEDNLDVLTQLARNLAALGFDPSNPKILPDKLASVLTTNGQVQTPNDNQDEGSAISEPRPNKTSFLHLKFPFLSPGFKNIPNIKNNINGPKDLPSSFNEKDEDTNTALTAGSISRRHVEVQSPPTITDDNILEEKLREFMNRHLPKNRVKDMYRAGSDISFMYDSLLFPAAMEKYYEIQMASYFN